VQAPAPSHMSLVQEWPSSVQIVPRDLDVQTVWLVDEAHHWHSSPGLGVPFAMHAELIRHQPELIGWMQEPDPLHLSVVQSIVSEEQAQVLGAFHHAVWLEVEMQAWHSRPTPGRLVPFGQQAASM